MSVAVRGRLDGKKEKVKKKKKRCSSRCSSHESSPSRSCCFFMPSLLPTLKCTSLWILRSLRFPSSPFVLWRDVINCGAAPRLSPPRLGRRWWRWRWRRRLLFAGSWMRPRLGLAHRWQALPAGLRGLPEAMTSFASGLCLLSCKRWEAPSLSLPPPTTLPLCFFHNWPLLR